MGGLALAVLAGLVVALVAFFARHVLLPVLQRVPRRALRSRQCHRLFEAALRELDLDIARLEKASLASREKQDDGTERVFYRFGSAYSSLAAPDLPIIRRAALDDLASGSRSCLGDRAGLLDDALVAIERYESIDIDRFRDAWHGAMNPAMERMVIGDPGHKVNRANVKVIIDTDRQMAKTRSSLCAFRDVLWAVASPSAPHRVAS